MKILITAFGPFDGRPRNASALALAHLKHSHPRIRSRVFPVDSVLAPARLRSALKQVRPDAVLMLGEAAGSTAIRLETTAWNQLDFSIPDAAGRQPRGIPIDSSGPDHFLTNLPVQRLQEELVGAGHDAMISNDAGRYLCNQLMYQALAWLSQNHPTCLAGFIHLPLASHYPSPRAASALETILSCVRSLTAKSDCARHR